jgi:hypothetical protein
MIFDGIERYIAKSQQTTGKTFHVTMTYFWIQMVHFGIRSMPLLGDDVTGTDSKVVEHTEEKGASPDFHRFLLLNPYLADGNLWTDYYSKGVIMTPEAKAAMVLPDLKPLPNLVSRETIKVVKSG